MRTTSLVKAKCYILVAGIEQSLGRNLELNYGFDSGEFLIEEERNRALRRLQEDLGDTKWGFGDIGPTDLLMYLDFGDLVNVMNRHIDRLKNADPKHVREVARIMTESHALTIRKRVAHPIRPLEPDDFAKLLTLAHQLQAKAPSLFWDPLVEGLQLISKGEAMLDTSIPSFWAEELPIVHNLPAAEFDDTGFIGRNAERKKLKTLLQSDHRVITVLAEGGKGKTALALRVCNDILDDQKQIFDRIVWVSLKTRYLTAEGVRQITLAVDSVGALIDTLLKSMQIKDIEPQKTAWIPVLEQLEAAKTLLVIDNLETIGEGKIRDLVMNIPSCSKVLFTSRVGLGELELRYELPDFALHDANVLFRSLADIYGYDSLKQFNNPTTNRYCKALNCNPLLIKWFVQAVGKGACPETTIAKRGFEEALAFCYANVYDKLDDSAKRIVAVLLAAKRELTKAQLQALTGFEHIQFLRGLQNLIRSCLIERVFKDDGAVGFQIGGLVYEYLSRSQPPTDEIVLDVRRKIRSWQIEQDKSFFLTGAFRYGRKFLHVETADERISAQHLHQAMQAAEAKDFDKATSALKIATQLTPVWWEIFRVEAVILELQNRPIYEIENSYEYSIKCKDTDVNRYFYAVYLNRQGEYDRALEQIDAALEHKEAIKNDLLGLRGLILMRKGKIDEAIPILEEVWNNRDERDPRNIVRARGTQLADAYCRHAEQMFYIGKQSYIVKDLSHAAEVVDKTINECGCDPKLAEMAINILSQALRTLNIELGPQEPFRKLADRWDNSEDFRRNTLGFPKIAEHFRKNAKLEILLPRLCKCGLGIDTTKRYSGVVSSIFQEYGFLRCVSLKTDVHFNQFSLVDHGQWSNLRQGTSVTFELILTTQIPHAVSMRLDSQA